MLRMKRLLPVVALFYGAVASADWVAVPRAADPSPATFIDMETIRQTGPMNTMRRVWQLRNLTQSAAENTLSIKSHMEYDCKDRRVRLLEANHFADSWGRGDKLDVAVPAAKSRDWGVIGKGNLSEAIFLRVCPRDGT